MVEKILEFFKMNIHQKSHNRIIGLDWLRGVCALSIMLYHLLGENSLFNFRQIISKLGVYGVSMFFILSGLSLAIVYHSFIKDFKTSVVFFIRRFFRIIPLYAFVCLLYIIPIYVSSGIFDVYRFLINISTLFGFFDVGNYIPQGGWSIGNEMMYYFLTPIVFIAYNKSKLYGNILFVLICIVGLLFAFYLIKESISLDNQWITYINPLNNFFLFVSGIFLFYNFRSLKLNKYTVYFLSILSIFLLIELPFESRVAITTKWMRVIYCLLSFLIVFLFYKLENYGSFSIGIILEKLGIATYGVYLLHPIVRQYLCYITNYNPLIIFGTIIITIIFSLISYYYFELRLMKLGKRISNRLLM
jgi:exopolysaccharide production protein ExoZ